MKPTLTRGSAMGLAAVMAFLPPAIVQAAPVDVASPEALAAALAAAGPGTVLRLAPGDYGELALRGLEGASDAPVVITSAAPDDPARFSRMTVHRSADVEIRGVTLDYAFSPGDEPWHTPFSIGQSRDVTLSGVLVRGDDARGVSATDDGFPTAYGISVRDTEGFTLEGSVVTGFGRGLVVSQSTDVLIRGNDLHGLRMDGMNFAEVSRVLIQGNWVHDFDRSMGSADHPDMIQFWTEGTDSPSTDVTIRANLLASGRGGWTQSIFIRNELVDTGRAGFDAMAYRRIRIEDNVILNAHINGIAVGEADGLVIENNAVLRNALSEGAESNPNLWTPQISVRPGARDVTIRRNVTAGIAGFEGQPGWQVEGNLLVQDRAPSRPGHYSRVFAGMPGGDPSDPASFAPRPGGPLDGTGIGPGWLGRRAP